MSDLSGQNLGSYRIIEQIGLGGMASVYKAYQPNMDRNVAIKILPRIFAQDPTFIGRFDQEAKVIAKLENARILPVYDYGEDDGITYIVMRYLEAGTLKDRLESGALHFDETARIIRQIAEGLDYAHSQGVIHRDIKPANILLDNSNDVYITDFGISKLVEGSAQFTGTGMVGTPAYVSPEQGSGIPIDHRTDIYSLGVVLYQMLIGDVPYHAETPMAVVIKHMHEPLPMPRSVNPNIPEALEHVVLKALAKEPEDRFQTCTDMAYALENAISAADDPSQYPTLVSQPTEEIDASVFAVAEEPTLPQPTPIVEQATVASAPPEKSRPGWMLPAAIGGLLGMVLVIVVLILLLGRGPKRPPGDRLGQDDPLPPDIGEVDPQDDQPIDPDEPGEPVPPEGEQPIPPEDEFAMPPVAEEIVNANFDNPDAVAQLNWSNEAPEWIFEDGQLMIPTHPGTGLVERPLEQANTPLFVLGHPAPIEEMWFARVDVTITPFENRQSAGLVILTDEGFPIVSLVRGFCEEPGMEMCAGDAIYMMTWVGSLREREPIHFPPVGMGELPEGAPVTLGLARMEDHIIGVVSGSGGRDWHPVAGIPINEIAAERLSFVGMTTSTGGTEAPAIPAFFDNFIVGLAERP